MDLYNQIVLDIPRKLPDGQVVYEEVYVKDILENPNTPQRHLDLMFLSILAEMYCWFQIPPKSIWQSLPIEQKQKVLVNIFKQYCRLVESGYPSYFFRHGLGVSDDLDE